MYSNLKDSELDGYIYRIFSYDRFVELFTTRKNTLVKPKKWEDTFENFALKSVLKFADGTKTQLDTHERMFGQCWTASKASDAMWRIYSENKKGIRVRTTINKLFDSISITDVNLAMADSCIGKVDYRTSSEIVAFAKKAFNDEGRVTFGSAFKSLLIKRKAFVHENEVRLLHFDWAHELPKDDLYSYDIDPHEIISQVMIDPRVSFDEFKILKKEIREITNYKGSIKRSLLYALPEPVTIELGQSATRKGIY